MVACYGGTDVMERSCAVARGKDINPFTGSAGRLPGGHSRGWLFMKNTIQALYPCLHRIRLYCDIYYSGP